MSSIPNEQNNLALWIAGALLLVVLTIGGTMVRSLFAEQSSQDERLRSIEISDAVTQNQLDIIQREAVETNVRLDRIEDILTEY